MRVYLPTTPGGLQRWLDAGVADAPLLGWAVTSDVRRLLDDADGDELEYAVTSAAAAASGELAVGEGSGRRIVVVAEVPDETVIADDTTAGAVTVREPVAMSSVASVLADAAPREPSAASSVEDDARDLGWFGVQEIPALLA